MKVLQKLDMYWERGNPSIREKLRVHDSIVRSKLKYRLAATAMNEAVKHNLHVFQFKGLGAYEALQQRLLIGVKTEPYQNGDSATAFWWLV